MAGPHIYRNPASVREDGLAGDVSTKGSNTPISSSAISWTQIPTLAQAFAPTPGPPGTYTNIDL